MEAECGFAELDFSHRTDCGSNGREKTGRKTGGQKGHKGTTLTRAEAEGKISSGRCRHIIKEIGIPSSKDYITKYVVDLDVAPLITEIRIYADEGGNFHIPPESHNDVTYGPNVKSLSVTLYSEGVISNDRIAAFLNAAGNGEQNYIRNFNVLRLRYPEHS